MEYLRGLNGVDLVIEILFVGVVSFICYEIFEWALDLWRRRKP